MQVLLDSPPLLRHQNCANMSKVIPESLVGLASSSSTWPTECPRTRASKAAESAGNTAKSTGSTSHSTVASGATQGAAMSAEAIRAVAAHQALVQYAHLSWPVDGDQSCARTVMFVPGGSP
jgi:hypothetical protein